MGGWDQKPSPLRCNCEVRLSRSALREFCVFSVYIFYWVLCTKRRYLFTIHPHETIYIYKYISVGLLISFTHSIALTLCALRGWYVSQVRILRKSSTEKRGEAPKNKVKAAAVPRAFDNSRIHENADFIRVNIYMDGWTVDTRCRDLRCVRVFIQVQTVGGQPSRHSASLCVLMLILLDVFVVAGCRSCRSLLGPGSVHLSAVHTIYIYIYLSTNIFRESRFTISHCRAWLSRKTGKQAPLKHVQYTTQLDSIVFNVLCINVHRRELWVASHCLSSRPTTTRWRYKCASKHAKINKLYAERTICR